MHPVQGTAGYRSSGNCLQIELSKLVARETVARVGSTQVKTHEMGYSKARHKGLKELDLSVSTLQHHRSGWPVLWLSLGIPGAHLFCTSHPCLVTYSALDLLLQQFRVP